jgi:hypothetical protein
LLITETNVTFLSNRLSSDFFKFFDKKQISQLAIDSGFMQRCSKMKPWMFIESLLFSKFNYKKLCLNDIAVDFSMKYRLAISKQGIDERFNMSSVKLVKSLLTKMIEQFSLMHQLHSVFSNYRSIRIKDSTSFQLPENLAEFFPGNGGNSSDAVARIQYEFDLKNGKILEMEQTKQSV